MDIPAMAVPHQMSFSFFLFYSVLSFSPSDTSVTTDNFALYLELSLKVNSGFQYQIVRAMCNCKENGVKLAVRMTRLFLKITILVNILVVYVQ
jgi:hypothetical protein